MRDAWLVGNHIANMKYLHTTSWTTFRVLVVHKTNEASLVVSLHSGEVVDLCYSYTLKYLCFAEEDEEEGGAECLIKHKPDSRLLMRWMVPPQQKYTCWFVC